MQRRLDGWGHEGEGFEPPSRFLDRLEERLPGEPTPPFPRFETAGWRPPSDAGSELPAAFSRRVADVELSTEPLDRLRHARGQALPDLLRLRSGTVPRLPAAVARPRSDDDVAALLDAASATGVRVVPWGGGTSVTGGVNTPSEDPHGPPALVVDLEHLAGLEDLDEVSRLATFGAGTLGPALEASLAPHGLTLGHFPQSFQLSTLGGWIVTRSSGQESLGYGRLEERVAGLDLVAPAGRLHLPALPATSAGPELRRFVAGSEGRLGIVTRAVVEVDPRPASGRVEAFLLRDWQSGVEGARRLVQGGVPLSMLRLSDETETAFALAVGLAKSRFEPLVRGWLRLRGVARDACLLLVASNGEALAVDGTLERVKSMLRPLGAVALGAGPGRNWRRDRFRHPYLRDALLDRGLATETLETAAPWSRLDGLYQAVREALGAPEAGPVLCHLSHPYRDGASLYFTFFYRCPSDVDEAIAAWAERKQRATEAIARAGGALSHHHGVGAWHAPWLGREIGTLCVDLVRATARTLDPTGCLNPDVLLPTAGVTDRLPPT